MTLFLATALVLFSTSDYVEPPDMSIPAQDIALIRQADYVQCAGTDAMGHEDDFDIHNAKAIAQFVELLTSELYVPVPKSLNPHFKSPSRYDVKLYAKGALVFELQIVALSVLNIPKDDQFYMESSRHSQVLMAPLFRLRG